MPSSADGALLTAKDETRLLPFQARISALVARPSDHPVIDRWSRSPRLGAGVRAFGPASAGGSLAANLGISALEG
jgi:hypothetical protein